MRHCPDCGYTRAWKLADGRLKCRRCGKRYTWTSVWDASRLPAASKRKLVEYFVLGVSSYHTRFRGLASPPTIERLFRLIRAVLAFEELCREPFRGPVECDETMFLGKRRGKRGRFTAGKVIVLGILQCNGLIRIFPVQDRSSAELIFLVCEHTRPGSLYYTDDWHAYASLVVRGDSIVVREEGDRPKGPGHISGIEDFWRYAKHWLYSYRVVPRKFFHIYLGEISFRFNHRDEDLLPCILKLMKQVSTAEIDPLLVRSS
jgi:transposase